MSTLSQLRFQRDRMRSCVGRFVEYVGSLDSDSINETVVAELKARLIKLEETFAKFSEIQSEIELQLFSKKASSEDKEAEYSVSELFEKSYFELVANVNTIVSQFQKANEPAAQSQSPSQVMSSNAPLQTSYQSTKLPVLQLPNFYGNIEKWLEFRDIFTSLVITNPSLDNIQRLYYLRTSLRGDAAEVTSSIPVSADNFGVAWSCLVDRYENKKLIVFTYIRELFEAPVLTRESHADLRKLFDIFSKNLRSLKSLGMPTETWDIMLIHLLVTKFDYKTKRDWEDSSIRDELPTMIEMREFLKHKCEVLEKLSFSKQEVRQENKFKQDRFKPSRASPIQSFVASNGISCYFCGESHSVFKCGKFSTLSASDRLRAIKDRKLCVNCFNPSHSVRECRASGCRLCRGKHNTLVHCSGGASTSTAAVASSTPGRKNDLITVEAGSIAIQDSDDLNVSVSRITTANSATTDGIDHGNARIKHGFAFLSTAVVNIENNEKRLVQARILLDPGSQSNFVTEDFANKLGLARFPVNFVISGIAHSNSTFSRSRIELRLLSRHSGFAKSLSCLVLSDITHDIPAASFDIESLDVPEGINLADPSAATKGKIDVLCGVGFFYDILLMNQIKLKNGLTMQNTRIGWMLAGELSVAIGSDTEVTSYYCAVRDETCLCEGLKRFWQVEECDKLKIKHDSCEAHFKNNVKRDLSGRFIVKIPFKDNVKELGNSREIALKRFMLLERKLMRDSNVRKQYLEFMSEYETLGHMRVLTDNFDNLDDSCAYYIPHHAVFKETSLTTKCRVVFDASAKTNKNLSLNDVHFAGPTVQSEIFDILLRFRQHKFVISADISKMYRQILVDPQDTRYQRIFWRSDPSQKLKCYELLTVTYGMAASPYLATRCLVELARENKQAYPLASYAIENNFYVDDLLTGCDSEEQLLRLQADITQILESAGFDLRKWLSNNQEICRNFKYNQELDMAILDLGVGEQNKTLGVYWDAVQDKIQYRIGQIPNRLDKITKRIILSISSQIFDPLGLLGPVVVRAKMILQLLWRENITWDEPVSATLQKKWIEFCVNIQELNLISIPRHVVAGNSNYTELHAFADASEKAYGCCVYIRTKTDDTYVTRLLCAKSKVAPIKQITLPRLELCAAVLAAKLATRVLDSLNLTFDQCFYWTDSSVTWHWIRSSPDRYKTFVANRISCIQTLTDSNCWYHVGSQDNPADIISRGTSARHLHNNILWWEGPAWLKHERSLWPERSLAHTDSVLEQRVVSNVSVLRPDFDLFSRYSSLTKLKRVTAYCKRFINNIKNVTNRVTGPLSTSELNSAMITLLKISQLQIFFEEYKNLRDKGNIQRSSSVLSLHPFLDQDGLIRVGGRLAHADISYSKKHQIIIHNKHPLAILIVRDIHYNLLHCGPQHLLYAVRENYWPISGRNLARKIVHECIICFRTKPNQCDYLMGELPVERVNTFAPFINTGCDYVGPFMLKDRKTRKPSMTKAWVSIFVCMSTKAVHLEVVSDLTTQAFLDCLRRFIARRGKPARIFSDNSTTFMGANALLLKFIKENKNDIQGIMANEGIAWNFIPPRAPHFGGLWEAGVKSFKYHFKRVVGNCNLHFEDFNTVLSQIESVLNSRPISPLSSDPNDYLPLTPGHFLIGRPITSLPGPNLIPVPENRLTHHKKLQQIFQHFWRRWNQEYLTGLQTRTKWKRTTSNRLEVGSLVIVKEDNAPPLQWRTARVRELHPGKDNIVRVATVQYSDGTLLRRPLTRLCVLPVEP